MKEYKREVEIILQAFQKEKQTLFRDQNKARELIRMAFVEGINFGKEEVELKKKKLTAK